jgi:hypothetical protein
LETLKILRLTFAIYFFSTMSISWLQLPHTNPGLNTNPLRFTKYSNAYMLVYIRESDKEKIICDLDETDISEHLKVNCFLFFVFTF